MEEPSKMIYDNPEFFSGYQDLRMNDKGLNGIMEEPSIRSLIGDVKGKVVLDIGCGFGHQLNWLIKNGAKSVIGIDPSKKMHEEAKKYCTSSSITLVHGYYEETNFECKFDHIVSSMAFHYVVDLEKLFKKCFSDLSDDGKLTFSIEHPVCTANTKGYEEDSNGKYWNLKHYHEEGQREFNWFVEGVIKNHRTIKTIINSLILSGFQIRAVDEPYPLDREYDEHEKKDNYFWIRPSVFLVTCQKT